MLTTLLVILHIGVCFFLIGVVLIQQGKGTDIAGAFGGGGGQAAFGARSGATFMHKLTVVAFVLFLLTSIMLTILNRKGGPSVVDSVEQTTTEVAAEDAVPGLPAEEQAPTENPAGESEVPAESPQAE